MKAYDRSGAREMMNHCGMTAVPFLFIIDFDMNENFVLPVVEINDVDVLYDLQGFSNAPKPLPGPAPAVFRKYPPERTGYQKAFDTVRREINAGNTYLLNLTLPTRIETELNIRDIFNISVSKYRLWLRDRFVVFSPESFVRIHHNMISSYPMKGTIDADVPDAEQVIINDLKETAEHNTITDLIRNDLSMVAEYVKVSRYRYLDRIKTNDKNLLQVSSEITGQLEKNWQTRIGDIIFALLPAGSVTGAPKRKTIEIIRNVEGYQRGFYTGIFGYWDGQVLDSAVMIRYIEQDKSGNLWYKSGGGITAFSLADKEYEELINKVYVPLA